MAQSRSTFLSLCGSAILFSLLGLLLPVAVSAAERPSGQPPERIRIAYSSISGNMAPLWVAYERGFLRKYGLDVQLIFIGGGSQTVQALIGGDVSLAQVAGAGVIQADLQGADLAMIAGVINTLTFHLYVDKTIASPDQLKGKAVGVTRYGSSTDFAMRYALEKYGLQPDKDVTILQLGTVPATLSALEAGKIQGAMLSVPTTLKAKKLGFSLLANLQMLGLEYQHTGLAVTRSLIKSRPDLVGNLLKAYVEAIHYFKTNPKEVQAIYQKYLKTDDPEILAETYAEIAMLIPEKPYPTLKGIDLMLRELSAKEPKAQTAKAEQFVNLTFIRELDKSGFIDRLYKPAQAVASAKLPSSPAQTKDAKAKTAPVDSKGAALKPAVASSEKANSAPAVAMKESPGAPAAPQTSAVRVKKAVATGHQASGAPSPAGEMVEYTIKAGDTLSKLAARFYGTPMKWEKIYEANTQTVKNPHYIYVGQIVKIPPA